MCFKIITQKMGAKKTPCCPNCFSCICCCPNSCNKLCSCCKEDDTVIAYNLIYYPGAWAKTDPPDSFGYLIAQRRRWINGSNFVFFYIIKNICEILNSNHSCFQKLAFFINAIASLVQQLLGFISSGLFYGSTITFIRYILKIQGYTIDESIIEMILFGIILVMVLVSVTMGKSIRNNKVNILLIIACVFLCVLNLLMIGYAYYMILKSSTNISLIVSVVYLVSYLVPPIIFDLENFFPEICSQIAGLICYLLTIPMYQIVFQLFAYANIHDVSWGNRDAAQETQQTSKRKKSDPNEELKAR